MPPRRRPVIGVTGPDRGGFAAWIFTRLALARAGAKAVRITPSRPFDTARLDGLVIGGGADVTEPLDRLPVEGPPPRSRIAWPRRALDLLLAPFVLAIRKLSGTRGHGADRHRDALEFTLLDKARARDLPVLGICRGAQLMSVTEGGAILRNVDTLYDERPQLYTVLPRREVSLVPGSLIHRVIGRDALLVNSLHFHAIDRPGHDMLVTAREPSGLPQAIEHRNRRFWVGVQWHPEYLPHQESHQRLFQKLVDVANEHRVDGRFPQSEA